MLGGEPHHGDGVAGLSAHFDRRVSSGRSVRIPSELAGWVASLVPFARLPVGRVGGPGFQNRVSPDGDEMNRPVGGRGVRVAFTSFWVALRARLTFSFTTGPLLVLVGHGLLRPLPWGIAGQLGRALVNLGLGHWGGPEPGLYWARSTPPEQRPGERETEDHRGGSTERRRFGRVRLVGAELLGRSPQEETLPPYVPVDPGDRRTPNHAGQDQNQPDVDPPNLLGWKAQQGFYNNRD